MIKFLIILALVTYVISKIGGFFFRVGAASQQRPYQPPRPEGSVNVDAKPKKEKRSSNIKGGDYVDYEEVK